MLLDYVGVCISYSNRRTFLDDVELIVESHHLDTPVLVAHDAFRHFVSAASVVASALADDFY